jgi:hypothetical protein
MMPRFLSRWLSIRAIERELDRNLERRRIERIRRSRAAQQGWETRRAHEREMRA